MNSGWETKKLGDICVVDWGNTNLTKSSYIADGKYLAVSAAGCDGRIGHAEHKKYTPVLSAIGAQCGRMFFPEEDFTAIKNTITLTPKQNTDSKFLYYLLTAITLPQRGAGQPFISKGDIQKFAILMPPLPEQQRIVAVLDEAFAGIATATENARKNLQNARELFENTVDVVFNQESEDWPKKKLSDIAYLAGRIGWKGLTAKEYTKTGPLFLSVHSLNYGDYVDFGRAFHISQERYDESPEIMLMPEDVLICKDGAGIGKMGIINELPGPATINSSMLLIRPLSCIKAKYLYRALCSQSFQRIIKEKIDGATTPHLYQRDIRQFLVTIPPLDVQDKIIKKLDSIYTETKRLEAIYQQKLDNLSALKQSILQKAFAGELSTDRLAA